jgi:hypothetical protein
MIRGESEMSEQKGRIIILRTVRADLPWMSKLKAEPGVYDAWVNPYGAVSVKIGEEFLGIKPGEFEWLVVK